MSAGGKLLVRLVEPHLGRLAVGILVGGLMPSLASAQSETAVTPAQERYVRERMDHMAIFEASLNACGEQTDAETRVVEAVQACVDDGVLARLAEHWRGALTELGDLALVEENRDEFCSDPELQTSLEGYVAYIDELIVQAEEFCP